MGWRGRGHARHSHRGGRRRGHGEWDGGRVGEELVRSVGLRERILGGEEALGCGSVTLAFGVLLEGIGDGDSAVAEVLAVHGLDGRVGGVERGVVDEGEALRVAALDVSLDLTKNSTTMSKSFTMEISR